jgi:hypothetical protein
MILAVYACQGQPVWEPSLDVMAPVESQVPEIHRLSPGVFHDEDAAAALAVRLHEQAIGWLDLPPVGDPIFEIREGESVAAVRRRVAEVAQEAAALARVEEPVWRDDDGTRTARLLMCVAFYESGFRGYVDDGRCDDALWRATPTGRRIMRRGDCDGGNARSLWQLHGFRGDRHDAIREALRRMRASITNGSGMRGFTGEWTPAAPKAQERLTCASRG